MHIYAKMILKQVTRKDVSITSGVKSAKVLGSELKIHFRVAGSVILSEGAKLMIEN